ncbi:MAG TPA: ribose-phosphate diphosphokinase [Candidatus Obscuribacter sp.]|nr:ribose-phosphate diphosphokinase [Candidatus Obscuribacter sp.]
MTQSEKSSKPARTGKRSRRQPQVEFRSAEAKPIIFFTVDYQYYAERMLATGLFQEGSLGRSMDGEGNPLPEDVPFADGERYLRLLTDVEDRCVVIVGGTVSDRETMDLLDLCHKMVEAGAGEIRLVLPFFGYSTMERAVKPGEAVKAKTRALLISAVLKGVAKASVFMVDLHVEGLQHYFEYGIKTHHVYAKPVIIESVQQLLINEYKRVNGLKRLTAAKKAEALAQPFVFASTDTGRVKWVDSLCRDMVKLNLKAEPAFIIKRRINGDKTEVQDISADVAGKLVIIYDDMVRTGGSLIKAARAYLKRGAAAVVAVLTHGVLPPGAKEKLADSGVFQAVVVTDSHPRAVELADSFLVVNSIAELLAQAVSKGRAELV